MAKDEVKQIMINGHLVGIVGLSDIIEKQLKTSRIKVMRTLKTFC